MLDLKQLKKQALAAKRAWSQFTSEHAKPIDGELKIGIAGSFTAEPVIPYIGNELVNRGVAHPSICIAPFDQVFQTCLDPKMAFGCDVDAVVLLIRIEDMFSAELRAFMAGDDSVLEKDCTGASELFSAVRGLRASFQGPIFLGIPPYPDGVSTNLRHLRAASRAGLFHRAFVNHWCHEISLIDRTHAIDLDGLQRYLGAANCSDSRKWYLYHQPYPEEFWMLLGEDIARTYAALIGLSKKCVVVDCDNTLWGGVVGEDGLEGIQIGSTFPGNAFCDFQQQLIDLHNEGVFISITSKNNEADVWEVFEKHDGMLLKRSHLAAWRINWLPKVENIKEIAVELNIGLDSFVFVDDSNFEIESVKQMLPQVTCIQVPEEPADLPDAFAAPRLFDRLSVTSEDLARTAMASQERGRKEAMTTMNKEDFLKSLGLVVDVFEVGGAHVGRVVQLINKTNQFNLTTIRRTQDDVEALRAGNDHRLFAMRVNDRFGDYGLVGVAIVSISDLTWDLDTFLLSCRVLGRGVETAFLAGIKDTAQVSGATSMVAHFLPTPKNKPAGTFLPDHRFEQTSESDWVVPVKNVPDAPAHIAKPQA
jgi:FkbH-like protein